MSPARRHFSAQNGGDKLPTITDVHRNERQITEEDVDKRVFLKDQAERSENSVWVWQIFVPLPP